MRGEQKKWLVTIHTLSIVILAGLLCLAGCKNPGGGGDDPSVTKVIVNGADTVAPNGNATYTADVTATGGASKTVTWSVEAKSGTKKTGTAIESATGELTVASDEIEDLVLVVKATSTFNQNKFGVKEVTVTNESLQSVTGVAVNGAATVAPNGNATYTAIVTATGGAPQTVTWSVEAKSGTKKTGTSIDNNGKLIVASDEIENLVLVVKATSTFDGTQFGVKEVTVTSDAPVEGSFNISVSFDADFDGVTDQYMLDENQALNITMENYADYSAVYYFLNDEDMATVSDGEINISYDSLGKMNSLTIVVILNGVEYSKIIDIMKS